MEECQVSKSPRNGHLFFPLPPHFTACLLFLSISAAARRQPNDSRFPSNNEKLTEALCRVPLLLTDSSIICVVARELDGSMRVIGLPLRGFVLNQISRRLFMDETGTS